MRRSDYGNSIEREELAWAAGLFDGEGTTYFHERNKYPILSLCQAGDYALEILDRFGAALAVYHDIRLNRVLPSGKLNYQLHIVSYDRVNYALDLLWPWLSTQKKIQAKECLAKCPIPDRPFKARLDRIGPHPLDDSSRIIKKTVSG
jgi:hypothetical protein